MKIEGNSEERIDRRVLRTRSLLQGALLELIEERGFGGITIGDIASRADVGRATFYTHYHDKEDLLYETLKEGYDGLVEHLKKLSGGDFILETQALHMTYRYVDQNRGLFKAILSGAGEGAILKRTFDYIAREAEVIIAATHHPGSVPFDVAAGFVAGSLLNLVTWWLETEPAYTPEEMAVMTGKLMMTGLTESLVPKRKVDFSDSL